MERLTHEADFGLEDWEETLFFVKSDPNGAYNIIDIAKYQGNPEFDEILKNVALRLAAYEDTGLEPENIISAADMAKIACALHEFNVYKKLDSLDRLRELAEADREGRCVVLPRLETGQGDPPGDPGPQGRPGLCPNCNDWRGLVWDETTGDSRCTICGWTNAKT